MVVDRVGQPLGEKRRALEGIELLFNEVTHQVRDIHLVNAIAKPALEAVRVEQTQEQLEILFFATMRRCREQQKVARNLPQHLPKLVAFGIPYLPTKKGRRHLMCLVHHNQIPLGLP